MPTIVIHGLSGRGKPSVMRRHRIFVGPIALRHLFIDYGDRSRARLHIFGRQIASFEMGMPSVFR